MSGVLAYIIIAIFTLSILSILPFYSISIVSFAMMLGLSTPLRRLSESIRIILYFFLGSVSFIASYAYTASMQSTILESIFWPIIVMQKLFWSFIVFPLMAYLTARTKPNKLIALFVTASLILAVSQIELLAPMRTYSDGLDMDTLERIAKSSWPEALSMLRNGEKRALSWYIGIAYYLRNSLFGYGLAHIDAVGIRGVCSNETHVVVFAGIGIAVGFYRTEYKKPLLSTLDFEYEYNFNASPRPENYTCYGVYAGSMMLLMMYLLFNSSQNITTHFNGTWKLTKIIALDGREIDLKKPLPIRHLITIKVSEKSMAFMSDIYPDIFHHPISVFINYNPSLDVYESLLFYKYEIAIAIILIWAIEILREYGLHKQIKSYLHSRGNPKT